MELKIFQKKDFAWWLIRGLVAFLRVSDKSAGSEPAAFIRGLVAFISFAALSLPAAGSLFFSTSATSPLGANLPLSFANLPLSFATGSLFFESATSPLGANLPLSSAALSLPIPAAGSLSLGRLK